MIEAETLHAVQEGFATYQEQAATFHFQPLTITATMRGTLSITRPEDIALDGLLARSLLEYLLGHEYYLLPDAREAPLFLRLPLAIQGPAAEQMEAKPAGAWLDIKQDLQDRAWWYACSTARIDVLARDTHYWNKRFDARPALSDRIDFKGRVEKVIIENGPYKAYHQPLPVIICRTVSWSCLGDKPMIEHLLTGIRYLGKKRSYGEGAIRKIVVQEAGHDESLWRADGTLARPVPTTALPSLGFADLVIDWLIPCNLSLIAYRAPQWAPYNQTLCAVGGKRRASAEAI